MLHADQVMEYLCHYPKYFAPLFQSDELLQYERAHEAVLSKTDNLKSLNCLVRDEQMLFSYIINTK